MSEGLVRPVRRTRAERAVTASRRMLRAARQRTAHRGDTRTSLAQVGQAAGVFVGMLRGGALPWITGPGCSDLEAGGTSRKHASRRHLAA
jgi:hypothetical protein